MAWLALVATLLTAVMPTVSRVIASAATSATPLLLEMCTAAGIKLVEMPPPLGGDAPRPGHPVPPAMADACSYCVLATSLPVLLLLLGLVAPHGRHAAVARIYQASLRLTRNARGLGSQAPPLAL